MGAYCLALAVHGTYPFGGRSRAVNDLGNQFVPYHAHLWDLMHGNTTGDLLFNWNSGYGAPFLADFMAYLMNPFSWLVGLFPRDAVNFPVFLVTLLSIGLGAAVMAVFLGRLHRGPGWQRGLLGAGYGLCAWVLNDGSPDPMWMWGLVSLPLVALACDWCLHERRWVLGTLAVAVAWGGNFYTGAMATIGAGLVLVLRVLLARVSWWKRARVLGRAAGMVVVGVLVTAPVILVSLKASRASQPAPVARYAGAPGLTDYLAQLLPGGRSDHSMPNIFIGVLGLLLVASLPFNRRVRVRERVGWYALLVAVGLSFVWTPTILLWHGLAMPNGSPYRAAFVLSGLLTMAAWVSLARRPDAVALLGGGGVTLLVLLLGHGQSSVRSSTYLLVLVGTALVVGALWALRRWYADRVVRRAVALVLSAGVLAGSTYAAYWATVLRDRLDFFKPRETISAGSKEAYRVIRGADDWPQLRTDPGPHEFASNDPLLLGGEGGAYYSSYLPAVTAQLLHDLGAGWYIQGRHTLSPADPVGRALFGVRTYLDSSSAPAGFTAKQAPAAAPLVSVRPTGRPDTSSVWARQESLLGSRVYDVPTLTPVAGPQPTLHGTSGWSLPPTPRGGTWTTFTGSCTPGSTAYLYGPWFAGNVLALGAKYASYGRQPMTAMPIRELGVVPADGQVRVALQTDQGSQVPAQPVGCLRAGELGPALAKLRAATAVQSSGHGLSAELPAGSSGTALVAVPATQGWECSVDGGPRVAPQQVLGMIGVPLGSGAGRFSCTFKTPGLTPGLLVSGAALVVVGGVALVTRLRRFRGLREAAR
ncbi:hypothetical protein CFP65_5091 [Kitasatospora sp. MMS16-BH015]|uniref:YfhO family protein n=1 Tax=Kitasatospora sp. MMS16-BH015 TaxID=2018025 RepID=UPI000CA0C819|nr:YfhO family protein [Kitasatospora sp. MMS16-BH015]AUG79802.1 hypothetical protein CFP65_5091 [Kitasatospora sp. MMS16-BH015]